MIVILKVIGKGGKMDILDLREPNKVINSAIEIIEVIKKCMIEQLVEINNMSEEEKEKVKEYIIDVYLTVQEYKELIKDLEKVRDFASEQILKIIEESIKDK